MDQAKPVAEIMADQLRSYSESSKEIRDGWTINTSVYKVCLTCLVEGGEEANMGTTINARDKVIELSNTIVVEDDQCDYVSEHE